MASLAGKNPCSWNDHNSLTFSDLQEWHLLGNTWLTYHCNPKSKENENAILQNDPYYPYPGVGHPSPARSYLHYFQQYQLVFKNTGYLCELYYYYFGQRDVDG
jgi:hypothetical protein